MAVCDTPCPRWATAPRWAAAAAERLAPAAWALKAAAAGVYTEGDVGYHADPATGRVALYGRGATAEDLALCKAAACRAVGPDLVADAPLPFAEAASGRWVKVAHSPLLRRAGELLNFFPGRYPGGVPNAPSPLAATLTGGLVGAGLGYGLGAVGEAALPQSFQRGRLRRTLAVLGGLGGAAPGGLWAASALARGVSPLDGGDLAPPAGSPPALDPAHLDPEKLVTAALADAPGDELYAAALAALPAPSPADARALEKLASGWFDADPRPAPPRSPLAVNVDALGRTLWESGADPRLVGSTVGALRAAASLPGGTGDPSRVTPAQVGELAAAMGAGYAAGAAAGAALGVLTGLPRAAQNALARSGAFAAAVREVVPALFGR